MRSAARSRTLRVAACLVVLSVAAAPAAADWNRSGLPAELRQSIHTTASEVPAFPQPDSTWKDPHAWPPTYEAVGKRFALVITARNGTKDLTAKTLAEVPPGSTVTLTYVNAEGPSDLLAGPSYQWDPAGRLAQRIWYEPDTVRFRSSRYALYPSGKLKTYELSARNQTPGPDDTLKVLTQYFEESGALAGFSYDLYAGGVKQSQWWWAGAPVSSREWDAYRKPFATN